jgi:outer membrane protein
MRQSASRAGLVAVLACSVGVPAIAQPAAQDPGAAPAPPAAQPPDAEAAAAPDAAPAFELREAPERQLTGLDALQPQPGGLTADRVAAKTVASSPTLAARTAEIDAAKAKVDAAVAGFLPRLKLTAMYRRVSPVDASLGGALVGAANPGPIVLGPCPDPAMGTECPVDSAGQPIAAVDFEFPSLVNHYSLNAQLAVPLSDYVLRLSSTMTATRANQRAVELQREAEVTKISSDARIAYYNWLRAVAGVSVAQSSLERFRAMLQDARTAFELGAVTKADVLRLEAAVASTELAITETTTLRELAEEQLAALMGEARSRYRVGQKVSVDPDRIRSPGKLADLVAEAYQRRLELKALAAASRSLRAAARAARVGQWPRLDAIGDLTYANPNLSIFPQVQEWNTTWAVGLSLSWTINDAFSGRATAAELEATRRKLQADRQNLERGIKLEVTSAYLDLKKAKTAIETAARSSVAAQEAYRVARDLYRVGRSTTTDLMVAESELVQASLKEVSAALDYQTAQVRLAHATGRDLPPGKDT